MEELQDAIEDAQYLNSIATQEDGPRPVIPWEIPNEEQLAEWEQQNPLSLPVVLSKPIGFFLFSSYCKDTVGDYLRINFCEDVVRWKLLRGRHRVDRAKTICNLYLKPVVPQGEEPHHRKWPAKTEIEEYDLERHALLSQEQVDTLLNEMNKNPNVAVGLEGPAIDEVFETIQDQQESMPSSSNDVDKNGASGQFSISGELSANDNNSPRKMPGSGEISLRSLTQQMKYKDSRYLPNSLFDKAEAVVVETLKQDYWNSFLESEQCQKMKNFFWYQDRTVVPDDFFVMRVLGRGGFGLVTACKKGTSGKLYAMKVMNKRRIKMKKSEQLALNERQALAAVESPFVVNLKYSFHSKDDIYLILDLMTGGDLAFHLQRKIKFSKRECQYYAARIMLGLQALHDKNYVYRDLKPENCLLAEDGRVKITDLGLATKIVPGLHGAAGTRGYWAPEMLRRDKKGKRMPYGHTVDWFSFGCCVAEFICGTNPFRSEAALKFGLEKGKENKEKAIDCATMEMDPELSLDHFDADAKDFCERLLDKNENTRLGANGCEEIMAHQWFRGVSWESIVSDRKRPPFVPPKGDVQALAQSQIGHFTEDKKYQETVITEKDEEVYKDWDWTNPNAFAAEVIEFLIYERVTGEPLVPISANSTCCCTIS